jgi:hypothetical protein
VAQALVPARQAASVASVDLAAPRQVSVAAVSAPVQVRALVPPGSAARPQVWVPASAATA